jgi:hypothetical protein
MASRRILKGKMPNINVTEHAADKRPGNMTLENFSYKNTWNMGYEGYGKPVPQMVMHPIYGNKGEYLFLLGLFVVFPLLKYNRRYYEDKVRSQNVSTNRWAKMNLDKDNIHPCVWDL